MKNRCLSTVLCLLSLLVLPSWATTNSLTYAASLGRYANGAVETYDLTGKIDLTVSLYSAEDSATPLWSHRVRDVAVYGGYFVVEISDSIGEHDDTCPNATYSRFDRLFASVPVTSAFWVEISNVQRNGAPLSELATGALQRGKITGVPFAVVAARSETARGAFRVSGTAKISVLKTTGRLDVSGDAAFLSSATFEDMVKFSASSVSVTGRLSKTTIEDLGTLEAERIKATKTVTANVFAITEGASTTLTPPSGVSGLTNLTVAGTLSPSGGTTVTDTLSAKTELNISGSLVVPDNATVNWTEGGALSVPDGVYTAGYTHYADVKNTRYSYSLKNETGRSTLSTLSYGENGVYTTVTVDIPGTTGSTKTWARLSQGAFNGTILIPMASGDTLTSDSGAINRYTKELSK